MKMQGYCNSTLWDLAFAVQAIASSGLASEFQHCLARAHHALDKAQVKYATDSVCVNRSKSYPLAEQGRCLQPSMMCMAEEHVAVRLYSFQMA